jgi:hypothetical protein
MEAMSDIKRYNDIYFDYYPPHVPGSVSWALNEHPEGEWVRYEDHLAAIEALKGKCSPVEGDTKEACSRLFSCIGGRWVDTTPSADHEDRIKALERSRFLLDGCIEICKKHEQRIEGLEKALNEHMVKEREWSLRSETITDCMDRSKKDWMTMRWDPKASPAGIPFEVALAYMKSGREVRRAKWQPDTLRVEPRGPGGVGGLCMVYAASLVMGDFIPTLADMLANDWMVIPEKQ